MKTKYQKPTTEMTLINVQPILAGSPLTTNASGELTEGTLQNETGNGGVLSRQSSIWGDDDEE